MSNSEDELSLLDVGAKGGLLLESSAALAKTLQAAPRRYGATRAVGDQRTTLGSCEIFLGAIAAL